MNYFGSTKRRRRTRRKRRQRRTRRKRRQRRTRGGVELFGFRRWVKKKMDKRKEKKERAKEQAQEKAHRYKIWGNISKAPDGPFNPQYRARTNGY